MTKQSCTSKMDDDEIQLVQVTVRFTCSADLHTPFYVSRIKLSLPRNPISLPNLILLTFNDYSVRKIDYYSQSDKNRLQHLLLRARTNSGIAIIFSLNNGRYFFAAASSKHLSKDVSVYSSNLVLTFMKVS